MWHCNHQKRWKYLLCKINSKLHVNRTSSWKECNLSIVFFLVVDKKYVGGKCHWTYRAYMYIVPSLFMIWRRARGTKLMHTLIFLLINVLMTCVLLCQWVFFEIWVVAVVYSVWYLRFLVVVLWTRLSRLAKWIFVF